MTKDIYSAPFTYYIAWTNIDKHYYGVRYAKGCQPSDLWTTYFTSSKLVSMYRVKYGEPDVIEIRKTFDNINSAIAWEHKVLKRLNVLESNRWLNQNIGSKKRFLKEHTLETRAQMSDVKKGKPPPNKGKPHSYETRTKISSSLKGKYTGEKNAQYGKSPHNKGKKLSPETKARMSAAKKGKPAHNKGKKHTPEAKAKMSDAKKAYYALERAMS